MPHMPVPMSSVAPINDRNLATPYHQAVAVGTRAPLSTWSTRSCPLPVDAVPTWKLNAPSTTCPSSEVTRHTTA